jgi:hypothetical protein
MEAWYFHGQILCELSNLTLQKNRGRFCGKKHRFATEQGIEAEIPQVPVRGG